MRKVIIIGEQKTEIIKINGIEYRKKAQQERKPISKPLLSLLTMAYIFPITNPYIAKKQIKIPDVDIVQEYELIQQKKSNLSKSNRDLVVIQFEKYFEIIK